MSAAQNLHLLLSSAPQLLSDCMDFVQSGDETLLADEGVTVLASSAAMEVLSERNAGSPLYALQADVAARGLLAHARRHAVILIDDADWVEAVVRCDRVLSWR